MVYKLVSVVKSPNPAKKWRATFKDGDRMKHTDFGQAGAPDFTLTGDEARRDAYRTRHKKDLDTGDYTRAGFLSYYLLWNKPTLAGSVRDYKSRFNM
jgi:hypothetical protein